MMNDNNFPHAILEINNPENLILFHKVVIPSSFGDETKTPPTVGKYANVLMVYEANGHAYLYSSDGIPTALGFSSGGILVVSEFPELDQAAQGFLYIKTDTGEAQITNDGENWTIIAGHYGAVYAVDAFPEPADAEPDSLYVDYATGVAKLTHDNQNWVTVNDNEHDVLLVETFPALDEAKTNVLYVSSTDQEARITSDNQHWVTISGGGGGGTSDFDQLTNRPKYAGQQMTSATDIPDVTALFNSLSSSLSAEAQARQDGDSILQQEFNAVTQTLQDDVDTLETQMTGKVDKVPGKGLSTNDFTNAYKNILDNYTPGGEDNVIEVVQKNGVALPITNKTVNVTVPTLVSQLTNDSNFVNTTTMNTALDNKVDKVAGKGLSTNDFTTTLKDKLDGIESEAERNIIEVVQKNGTALTVTNKTVNVTVPTKTSDLTNDSNFVNTTTLNTALDLKVDKVAGKGLSTNDFTTAYKNLLDTAVQPADLNYTVMTDLSLPTNPSTTSVIFTADKVNLSSGTTSDKEIALPVASTTQAGIINKATYDTIQDNAEKIEAILGGSVAIAGIAANPTQAALTTAWQTETGKTTVINGAKIHDTTNSLEWTYYSNDNTWHSQSLGSTASINQFTNTALGTIKGSTTVGQVFAEANGTGSVNGWDALTARVTTVESDLTSKVDKVTGKGLSTNDFTNALKTKLDGIEADADVNIIEKVQKNGVDLPITNKTVNVTVPTKTSDITNDSNFVTSSEMSTALANKVDKVTGKGLSTNDFTTALKDKLDSIDANADANVIEKVQRNGVDLAITNKTVNVVVPTKTSDLTNDSNYVDTTTVNNALNNKVDKETGKGLSSNDFTDAFKTKLEGIEAGAQVNSPLYSTTGTNTNGAMTQAATTNAIAQKLSHGNLTTSGGLSKTVTGSGTNTAIDVKISDGGVTTAKLADNAVTTAKITDLNVTTGKLANGAVTGVENDATSIGTAKLALDTVGTPNLRDQSVTSDKIDFTTFGNVPIGGTNGVPAATKEVTYTSRDIKITYTRVGNIVTAMVGQLSIDSFVALNAVVGYIPDGFAPALSSAMMVCYGYTTSGGDSALFTFTLRQNKEVNFSTTGWPSRRNFLGTVTYVTNEDFPV